MNNNIQQLIVNRSKTVFKNVKNMPDYYHFGIIVMGIFLIWFFTYFQFQFLMSVLMAIIVMLSISKFNSIYAVIFGLIYGYMMYQLFHQRRRILGKVIKETDIEKNGKPFVASTQSLIVNLDDVPKNTESNDFSYTFWIYINSVPILPNNVDYQATWTNYRYGDWKSVFYRGLNMAEEYSGGKKEISLLQQFPGVWLAPKENRMSIVFQNGEENQNAERVDIENIPLNQWVHCCITLDGYSASVYINGKLENIIVLNQKIPSSTDMNERNIYLCQDAFLNFTQSTANTTPDYTCPNGCINDNDSDATTSGKSGFAGFIGEMSYFPYVLNNQEISKNYDEYKKIIQDYQKHTFGNGTMKIPRLITNSNHATSTFQQVNI